MMKHRRKIYLYTLEDLSAGSEISHMNRLRPGIIYYAQPDIRNIISAGRFTFAYIKKSYAQTIEVSEYNPIKYTRQQCSINNEYYAQNTIQSQCKCTNHQLQDITPIKNTVRFENLDCYSVWEFNTK